ncbi:MAG TPA: DNA alkylation repair protein [Amaricoccus sp.]|uniref:DNA alkylation repair protein n=1 Tax=Amaricoccus sp. TaxID=1872485 RepID=UPI002BBC7672|nr:DNA alkylation repair protein [Amaricoccus sp.]HMQ94212.1 DNA alkylation repair protein [Amaricoccus sp.]HMR53219.1 DNA alkylation repair protein [Amaricoccus sp.]HMR61268.1 DNA alkylation repair protein [Amaricoccus sp.]HMU00152.1 DNA alkylation repair protein [Amaricoccus sp.]
MPEPFKTFFNTGTIAMIGANLAARSPGFDRDRFEALAGDGLEALELKARAAQITRALDACLPRDFGPACDLMLAALAPADAAEGAPGIRGWAVMPMADLVALRGLGDFDRAMEVLAEMTRRFSSEFAVRPFILADPERAMGHMMRWTGHADWRVRRLASEGSRPRLPWGMRLAPFVADPAPLMPLLGRLRDDPSEDVRRSVANSLNDIAKDHPDLVAGIARDWLAGAPPERRRLVRHACRSLVKAGHRPTLAALGFGEAALRLERLDLASPVVAFGEALEFVACLRSEGGDPQEIVLDYAIHHRKANGGTSAKVFKWRQLSLAPGETLELARRHSIRRITTRVYHDGAHRLEILANGRALGEIGFELVGAAAGQRVGTGVSPR